MTTTGARSRLHGSLVSITGRLASMSREEAVRRIDEAGARYVSSPTDATDLLVVGQGGAPLGEDGQLTISLRKAREIRARGIAIRIVREDEWLSLLGLEERQADMHRLFTSEQLARILAVPIAEVRAWVRHQLIRPVRVVNRLCYFDYPQVAGARSVNQLTQAGVSPKRIQKSLHQLATWMDAADRSPTHLEPLERAGTLLVRLEDGSLAEPTGQLRLGFERSAAAGAGTHLAPAPSLHPTSPDDWFERGILAEEEGRLEAAAAAYSRALEEDGARPDICFNLGNTLYGLERKPEAVDWFGRATEIDPGYVEAWNNLGNVLAELEETERAVSAYRHALAIAPEYADAHYNLAETLAGIGDLDGARRHWTAYLDQDPSSSWADEVRQRLAMLVDR